MEKHESMYSERRIRGEGRNINALQNKSVREQTGSCRTDTRRRENAGRKNFQLCEALHGMGR